MRAAAVANNNAEWYMTIIAAAIILMRRFHIYNKFPRARVSSQQAIIIIERALLS